MIKKIHSAEWSTGGSSVPRLRGAGGPRPGLGHPGPVIAPPDPFYERQARGHPLLILQVLLSEKVDQRDFFLLCPVAEEPPHCQSIAHPTDGVTQHHLRREHSVSGPGPV